MSDRIAAEELLRTMQRSTSRLRWPTNSPEFRVMEDRLVEDVERQLVALGLPLDLQKRRAERSAAADQTAGMEIPGPSLLLRQLGGEIEQSIRSWNARFEPPVIGTLNTGSPHALTVWAPNVTVPVVLVDADMFVFCYLMSKIYARVLQVEDDASVLLVSPPKEGFGARLDQDPDILDRLVELLVYRTVLGSASAARSCVAPIATMHVAETFARGMELFIVGHEYAHVTERDEAQRSKLEIVGLGDFEQSVWSWVEEVRADHAGAIFAEHAMTTAGASPIIANLSIQLALHSLAMVERAGSIINDGIDLDESGAEVEGSHPPADLRRKLIHNFLWERACSELKHHPSQEEAVFILQELLTLVQLMDDMSDELWKRSRTRLLELRKELTDIMRDTRRLQ